MKRIFTDWLGISIAIGLTALFWSFIQSQQPSLKILTTPKEPIVTFAGRPFTLCRKVKYLRDCKVEMSKALIKNKNNGDMVTINFPTVTFERSKGTQTICRSMVLPQGLSLGEWELHTYINVRYPPFWRHDFEAPIVKLWVSVYPQEIK